MYAVIQVALPVAYLKSIEATPLTCISKISQGRKPVLFHFIYRLNVCNQSNYLVLKIPQKKYNYIFDLYQADNTNTGAVNFVERLYTNRTYVCIICFEDKQKHLVGLHVCYSYLIKTDIYLSHTCIYNQIDVHVNVYVKNIAGIKSFFVLNFVLSCFQLV